MKPTKVINRYRLKGMRAPHVYECDNGFTYTADELCEVIGVCRSTLVERIRKYGLHSEYVCADVVPYGTPCIAPKPKSKPKPTGRHVFKSDKALVTRSGKVIPAPTPLERRVYG